MLDEISIKLTASVEKKTSRGFLCIHYICKSLRAHDLLTVSCFQLMKWWKVIGLQVLTATLPPSFLSAIFLPLSFCDRVNPAASSLFQQQNTSFMLSLFPHREGSALYSHLRHGEGLRCWEKANPLHSLGRQRSHRWSGRGAVLPVSDNALFGSHSQCWQLSHSAGKPWHGELPPWGKTVLPSCGDKMRSVCPPTECRAVYIAAGSHPIQSMTSVEDGHNVGTPCACAVFQRAVKFSGALERGREVDLDAVLKE